MRLVFSVILIVFLGFPAFAESKINPETLIADARQSKYNTEINKLEKYINDIKTMKAEFIQISPNGEEAAGILYMTRPGKMRWDYTFPNKYQIIINGKNLTYHDAELNQTTYGSTDDYIASLLATEYLNLTDKKVLVDFAVDESYYKATIQDANNINNQQIRIIVAIHPKLSLKKLEFIDVGGKVTTVAISNLKTGLDISKNMYYAPLKK